MRRIIALLFLSMTTLLWVQSMRQIDNEGVLAANSHLVYLGEGGSHTIPEGHHFIVKRLRPYHFAQEPGPTYEAAANERVWSASMPAPAAKVGEWVDYGQVPENCEISFSVIDDDVDNRINNFYIGDQHIYEMTQGLVTGGHFTTNAAGNLRLDAVDSIGIWLDKCDNPPTVTPTIEPSATPTEISTATSTVAAPTPTSATTTATATPPSEVAPTATPTGEMQTTSTSTSTALPPTNTPTIEPTATESAPEPTVTTTMAATSTRRPREFACLRINFEVSGHAAREGVYEVRELGGRLLYSWHAQDGWTDSGWIDRLDISFENVFVEVFYLAPDGSPPIKMKIVNPAPDTTYGWLSWGQCHALEVAWPDTPPPQHEPGDPSPTPEEVIWPGKEPTATPTASSSLKG